MYAYSRTDVLVVQCSVDSCAYQLADEAPPAGNPPKPTLLAADPCLAYPAAPIDLAAAVAPAPPKLALAALDLPKELPPAEGGPPKLGPEPPKAAAALGGPPKEGPDLIGDALVAPAPPKPTELPPKP